MEFQKYCDRETKSWDSYFKYLEMCISAGKVSFKNGGTILFPTMILFSDCGPHFACELLGASARYNGLKSIQHRESSIYRLLSQFDPEEPESTFLTIDAPTGGDKRVSYWATC